MRLHRYSDPLEPFVDLDDVGFSWGVAQARRAAGKGYALGPDCPPSDPLCSGGKKGAAPVVYEASVGAQQRDAGLFDAIIVQSSRDDLDHVVDALGERVKVLPSDRIAQNIGTITEWWGWVQAWKVANTRARMTAAEFSDWRRELDAWRARLGSIGAKVDDLPDSPSSPLERALGGGTSSADRDESIAKALRAAAWIGGGLLLLLVLGPIVGQIAVARASR